MTRHLRLNQAELRKQVFARDAGICAICGLDTAAAFEQFYPAVNIEQVNLRLLPRHDETCIQLLDLLQIKLTTACQQARMLILQRQSLRDLCPWIADVHSAGDCWDMDHQLPLIEGGSNDLTNCRTLCRGCHKQATAALAARLARRPRKRGQRV